MSDGTGHPERTDKSWRTRALLDLLATHGRLSVGDATESLGVSEATIRRDFAALARQQLATRTHGGLVATSVAYDLPMRYRSGDDAKTAIATAAANLVRNGQVVAFNGGTTTTLAARELAARGDLTTGQDQPALTIVTNALNIATELVLRPHIRTVSVGGVARPQSYEVVGPIAHQVLRELWIDHLFLGVGGLSDEFGASCSHEGEASVNALMVERSKETTIVADSSKFGQRTFARICDTSAIRRVITDAGAPDDELAALRRTGIEIIVA